MLVLSRFIIINLFAITLFASSEVNAQYYRGGNHYGYPGTSYGGTYVTDYGSHFHRVGYRNPGYGTGYRYHYPHYYTNYYHYRYPYRYREYNYYRYRDPYSYRYYYYRYPYTYRGYYRYNEYW